jgi:hypothetical protein
MLACNTTSEMQTESSRQTLRSNTAEVLGACEHTEQYMDANLEDGQIGVTAGLDTHTSDGETSDGETSSSDSDDDQSDHEGASDRANLSEDEDNLHQHIRRDTHSSDHSTADAPSSPGVTDSEIGRRLAQSMLLQERSYRAIESSLRNISSIRDQLEVMINMSGTDANTTMTATTTTNTQETEASMPLPARTRAQTVVQHHDTASSALDTPTRSPDTGDLESEFIRELNDIFRRHSGHSEQHPPDTPDDAPEAPNDRTSIPRVAVFSGRALPTPSSRHNTESRWESVRRERRRAHRHRDLASARAQQFRVEQPSRRRRPSQEPMYSFTMDFQQVASDAIVRQLQQLLVAETTETDINENNVGVPLAELSSVTSVNMYTPNDAGHSPPNRDGEHNTGEEEVCGICQEGLVHDVLVRRVNRCGHMFHHSCIERWLADHRTCPMCMQNIMVSPPQPPVSSSAAQEAGRDVSAEVESDFARPEQHDNPPTATADMYVTEEDEDEHDHDEEEDTTNPSDSDNETAVV